MSRQALSDRRSFLKTIGAASVCGRVSANAVHSRPKRLTGYAYVGSLGPAGGDGIEVFRIEGNRWTPIERVASYAPVFLLPHPNGQILYVANQVTLHGGLARGTVEVFSVDRQSGALSRLQRRSLSLSGIKPRGLALSPDGRHLLVAVYGGGAYNVLTVEQKGTLGNVQGLLKELGCGTHPEHQVSSHPHTLLAYARGRFSLASDLGCDRLSAFALEGDSALRRVSKLQVSPGAGPGSMVLHPGGSLLYVKHELRPAIACHRYRSSDGVISEPFQTVRLPEEHIDKLAAGDSLAMDARGRFLYASSGQSVTVWAVNTESGSLSLEYQAGELQGVHLSHHNGYLHALDHRNGCVHQMTANEVSGRWDDQTEVASVTSPISLALLRC